MKIKGNVHYELEEKEDLYELLKNVIFSFLPNNGSITQLNKYFFLLSFIKDHLKNNIVVLRKDKLAEFEIIIKELVELKNTYVKRIETLDKIEDI